VLNVITLVQAYLFKKVKQILTMTKDAFRYLWWLASILPNGFWQIDHIEKAK
jgi:hypothetical protein